MARKGENIYKRSDGRWEGRYVMGRKPDGKPHYGYVYGDKYGDVKTKLLPLKIKYANHGKIVACYLGTVNDWTKYWLDDVMRVRVRESTLAYYSGTLGKHVLPVFGTRKLSGLTREDMQRLADSLTEKGLSASTVHGIMGVLNRMLKAAVEHNALLLNPYDGVVLPKREPPKVKALCKADQRKLEVVALEDKDGLAVMLALHTGMRIGEICALKWSDVDLEKGVLRVRQTVQRIGNVDGTGGTHVIFGDPKSVHSKREIPLTQTMKQLLAREKARASGEFVVSCRNGMAEPRVVRYWFARIAAKAGLTDVRFHGLRHTFATRCMESGMDITTLSRILGHASVKMTLDVYTDSTWEQKAEAMRRLDRLYSEKRKTA